jgi:hypothetical protein
MNGFLACALPCLAFSLALANSSRGARLPSLMALALAAMAATLWPMPPSWSTLVLLGCWASAIVNGGLALASARPRAVAGIGLGLHTGLWIGASAAQLGMRTALLALPCALIVFPAAWLLARNGRVAVSVIGSWIVAVSLLVAALQFLPVTPGYLPDHIE